MEPSKDDIPPITIDYSGIPPVISVDWGKPPQVSCIVTVYGPISPPQDINGYGRKFVKKGWGYEDWICNSKLYCGKVLYFDEGKKCSWHYHDLKDEHFYVQDGLLRLYYSWHDDISKATQVLLSPGDSFHVEVGLRHRLEAIKASHVFEFSTQHFDTDSIRVIPGD